MMGNTILLSEFLMNLKEIKEEFMGMFQGKKWKKGRSYIFIISENKRSSKSEFCIVVSKYKLRNCVKVHKQNNITGNNMPGLGMEIDIVIQATHELYSKSVIASSMSLCQVPECTT